MGINILHQPINNALKKLYLLVERTIQNYLNQNEQNEHTSSSKANNFNDIKKYTFIFDLIAM